MRFCYFSLISLVYLWSGMVRADDPALTNNPLTLQSRTSGDLGALPPAGIDYGCSECANRVTGTTGLQNMPVTQCLTMSDVISICGGSKPTIWINPKLEPRDAANRLLGAFQAMGYEVAPKTGEK